MRAKFLNVCIVKQKMMHSVLNDTYSLFKNAEVWFHLCLFVCVSEISLVFSARNDGKWEMMVMMGNKPIVYNYQ